MKVLSPRAHAPVDYLLVALFGLAPTLFGFGGIAATLSYALATGVLVMSLLTAYPLGLLKIIPFPVHGYIELAAAPLLIAAPFLLGFDGIESARNLFVVTGAAYAIVFLLTDYEAGESTILKRERGKPASRGAAPVGDGLHISNRPMF